MKRNAVCQNTADQLYGRSCDEQLGQRLVRRGSGELPGLKKSVNVKNERCAN